MHRTSLSAAAAALFLAFAFPTGLAAQGVACKDGTTASSSGRGACSHHGGVASVAITVSCRDGSTATPGRGACSHHGGVGSPTATKTRSSTRTRASESTTRPSSARTSSGEGERVGCRDGTTSSAGRGACSHHGGVATATAPSSRRADVASRPSSTTERSGRDIPPPPPSPAPGAPADASAKCNDGTYSNTAHRSGACSHHGGVKQWYKDLPVRWY
jgi:hypothetical protein